LAINYLYKDDLKLIPSEVSRINGIVMIPWIIKPVYGLISDSFPIFGYRRKSYLFFFGISSSICWLLMSLWVDSVHKVILVVLVNQTSTAFCNVIGEALVVETSQKQKNTDPNAGAKNVSMFFLVKSTGSLLTAFSSGALLEYMDKRKVFMITSLFPLILVVSAVLLRESTVSNSDGNANQPSLRHQLSIFFTFLKQDQIYKPVIFIFLFMLSPSYGDPLFYFYSNVLNFGPMIMGRLKLIYGIATVTGIVLYNRYLKNVGFKKIVTWSTVLSMCFNMLTIVLVLRINLQLGISDFWFCMTADALTTALGEINILPLLVLACEICPKNIEGTLYAFLMSVVNFGTLLSNQFGAGLTYSLGITNTNFVNLPWLIVIANIAYILQLPSLVLIDDNPQRLGAVEENNELQCAADQGCNYETVGYRSKKFDSFKIDSDDENKPFRKTIQEPESTNSYDFNVEEIKIEENSKKSEFKQ
jgi:folate/biopterin transporter